MVIVEFVSQFGVVECRNESNHNALLGSVVANLKGTDKVSFAEGGFEFGESCKVRQGGVATAEPLQFPWPTNISRTGIVNVKGTPKVGFAITYESGARCVYEKKVLKGKAPTPESGVEKP